MFPARHRGKLHACQDLSVTSDFNLLMQTHYKQGNEVMAAMFSLEIAHRLKVDTVIDLLSIIALPLCISTMSSILRSFMKHSLFFIEQLTFK